MSFQLQPAAIYTIYRHMQECTHEQHTLATGSGFQSEHKCIRLTDQYRFCKYVRGHTSLRRTLQHQLSALKEKPFDRCFLMLFIFHFTESALHFYGHTHTHTYKTEVGTQKANTFSLKRKHRQISSKSMYFTYNILTANLLFSFFAYG